MNAAPSLTDAFRYPHFIAMALGVAGSPIASLLVYCEREPYLSWVRLQAGPWLPTSLFPWCLALQLWALAPAVGRAPRCPAPQGSRWHPAGLGVRLPRGHAGGVFDRTARG
jgi:hypothetical protein